MRARSLVAAGVRAAAATFTPLGGGRVRQLSEATSDGGKSWAVRYDFTDSPRARP